MNANQIESTIINQLNDIPEGTGIDYLSGVNRVEFVRCEETAIIAIRGGGEISIPIDHVSRVAEEFARQKVIDMEVVFRGGGNTRSAFEAILSVLPNICWGKENNRKVLAWFDVERHESGIPLRVEENDLYEGVSIATSSNVFDLDALKADLQKANLQTADELPVAISSALHAKSFLLLTGLSGSGKTQLAQVFSKWITPMKSPKDVFSVGLEIESSRSIYTIEAVGSLGLKVHQSGNDSFTFLPFDLIDKWIEVIQENGFDETKNAQEIQAVVQAADSGYSNTVNSFHSPLKALAFHKIRHQGESEKSKCVELIAVGADWTSNENLLGYPDALKEKSYRKPDNGALDLILRAQANSDLPYFLILDEMNLSHVERYFADFLSAMESGEAISLHDDTGADWNGVSAKVKIPKNLFVIGTVNVDETTYMFSPKVLDRANVIEFRVSDEEMTKFLANPVKPDLESIAGQGAQYAQAFVAAAKQKDVPLDDELKTRISGMLMEFFPQLKEAGAEFGYRTAHEICRFVYFYQQLSGNAEITEAMDAAIMQKLLPKLHGSKKKLGPVLAALIRLCLKEDARPENDPIKDEVLTKENAIYPRALEKLKRMRKRLIEHGFTSFAEA
jgi:energy-coupling factor transporter ATP-binding protein EcfA2